MMVHFPLLKDTQMNCKRYLIRQNTNVRNRFLKTTDYLYLASQIIAAFFLPFLRKQESSIFPCNLLTAVYLAPHPKETFS